MIICGIDPGTRATGYGVIEIGSSTDKYIAHGTIKPQGDDLSLRLKTIYRELDEIFRQYRPQEVAVETSFYSKNAQTALKLGQVRGVIFLAAALTDNILLTRFLGMCSFLAISRRMKTSVGPK